MSNSIFPKLGCCVLVGVLVPLGAAQAWDGSDIQEVSYLEDKVATPAGDVQALPTAKGAQGPIRTDMAEDKPAGKKSAAKQQESKYRDAPYSNDDGKNFPYSEGG